MVTYLELNGEPVWNAQVVPANMTALLVKPLRTFYGLGPTLIGAPGDNNHLRGRHRSRNWDLTSDFCTNRTYATTDARDRAGHGDHYRAIDVGVTGQKLYDASRRMDALIRSQRDGGKVAEWFGTFDGRTVVGWFEGRPSSSDSSHLRHLHVGVWTKWADDPELMRLLYRTITGVDDDMTPTQAAQLTNVEAAIWDGVVNLFPEVRVPYPGDNPAAAQIKVPNVLYLTLKGIAEKAGLTQAELDEIAAAARAGAASAPEGPLSLADVERVADAVVDEQHDRLAE